MARSKLPRTSKRSSLSYKARALGAFLKVKRVHHQKRISVQTIKSQGENGLLTITSIFSLTLFPLVMHHSLNHPDCVTKPLKGINVTRAVHELIAEGIVYKPEVRYLDLAPAAKAQIHKEVSPPTSQHCCVRIRISARFVRAHGHARPR